MKIIDFLVGIFTILVIAFCMFVVRYLTSSKIIGFFGGAILGVVVFLGIAIFIGFLTNNEGRHDE